MGDQAFPIGWIASGLPTTGGRYAGWNLVNRALVDSIIIDRSLLAWPNPFGNRVYVQAILDPDHPFRSGYF